MRLNTAWFIAIAIAATLFACKGDKKAPEQQPIPEVVQTVTSVVHDASVPQVIHDAPIPEDTAKEECHDPLYISIPGHMIHWDDMSQADHERLGNYNEQHRLWEAKSGRPPAKGPWMGMTLEEMMTHYPAPTCFIQVREECDQGEDGCNKHGLRDIPKVRTHKLSEHLRLRDFITNGGIKYVLVGRGFPEVIELVIAELVNELGIASEDFRILSGFRDASTNRSWADFSRHRYGDGIDFRIDAKVDGRRDRKWDDLDGDGDSDVYDRHLAYKVITALAEREGWTIGLGFYDRGEKLHFHKGPGFDDRWFKYAGNEYEHTIPEDVTELPDWVLGCYKFREQNPKERCERLADKEMPWEG